MGGITFVPVDKKLIKSTYSYFLYENVLILFQALFEIRDTGGPHIFFFVIFATFCFKIMNLRGIHEIDA